MSVFYIPIPLSFGLRIRLFASRLMAAAGSDTACRHEEEKMFMEITRLQGNLISSICLSFARTKEEFEDLRQDTLLNIWHGIGSFQGASNISTWVYRVTLNTCVSNFRKVSRSEKQEEALTEFYRELFDNSTAEEIERYELMYRLIAKLSPLDRSALLMWLDDKPYDAIAEVMGVSRNAVASRLKRSKERLAAMAADPKLSKL